MKAPSKLSSVILWSVISAAFIGPGTVTTAVTVGSKFGLQLLWAVAFSTLACVVLQEVSARITISSGLTLGETLLRRFGQRYGQLFRFGLGGIVIAGCAAYQAGNILGAVSGLNLLTSLPLWSMTILVTLLATTVLWSGRRVWISRVMIVLVASMGVAFVALAVNQGATYSSTVETGFFIPVGSELLVMGLVGTTIVPYNIFIGAGISKGQSISLMRIGLTTSVLTGGLITAAILVAGTAVSDFTSFDVLANTLKEKLGGWAFFALSIGLFAAGFSSSITAPFASSVIASNVFGLEKNSQVRATWFFVMVVGFVFGISGIKPIPVILTVQALNGFILPILTLFLILIVNDTSIVRPEDRHSGGYNLILLVILFVMLLIGLNNVDKAITSAFGFTNQHFWLVFTTSLIFTGISSFFVFRLRIKY